MATIKKPKVTMPQPIQSAGGPHQPVQSNPFTIFIKIENSSYAGGGATALEALRAIKAPELDYISSGSVTITHAGKSKEMFFPSMQMRRLLNPYNQEALIGDLAHGL